MLYEFTTTATNEAAGWHDTVTEYIFAYGYDHAVTHITSRLEAAGWKVNQIHGRQIPFCDIRDSIDHITD